TFELHRAGCLSRQKIDVAAQELVRFVEGAHGRLWEVLQLDAQFLDLLEEGSDPSSLSFRRSNGEDHGQCRHLGLHEGAGKYSLACTRPGAAERALMAPYRRTVGILRSSETAYRHGRAGRTFRERRRGTRRSSACPSPCRPRPRAVDAPVARSRE